MFKQLSVEKTLPFFQRCKPRFFLALLIAGIFHGSVYGQSFQLVKDINTGTNSNPDNPNNNTGHFAAKGQFAVLNGISYFAADDGINGKGLWRTDGTTAGTYQLKAGVNPSNILVANGLLIFIGDGNIGLWKSDGTTNGTLPVLSNLPGGNNSFIPEVLTAMNNAVYFAITGATTQLWKTNGIAAGTQLVKDFGSGVDAYFGLTNFSAIKNKLYFTTFNSSVDYTSRLWVTDGSAAGTFLISNKIAAPAQMIAASSGSTDSLIYFTGSDEEFGNRSLYTTEGKPGIANLAPGYTGIIPAFSFYTVDLVNINGSVYFSASTGPNMLNAGLYRYTAANGTQLVKIFGTNTSNGSVSYVQEMAEVNGKLFFSFYDAPGKKNQLWRTDGTAGGTVLFKDNFRAYSFTNADGQSYFWGSDGGLWKTDGNSISIVVADAINFAVGLFTPGKLTSLNTKFLFANSESTHGNELWVCDKTPAGTMLLKDINVDASASSNPQGLSSFNGKLFFAAKTDNSLNSLQLFKSDGTATGTSLISDSVYAYYFRNFKQFSNQVFFWATTKTGRQGIFKTDGTTAGTVFVKDLTDKPFIVNGIKVTDNLVYFYLYNSAAKACELWRTDGSTTNTYLLKNNLPVAYDFENAVAAGSKLYFSLDNNLWVTDGTVNGTQLLKSQITNNSGMAAYQGLLFFNATNGTRNVLWKTDGTLVNTQVVSTKLSNAANFIVANNQLFCLGTNTSDNKGQELYKTDGTDAGTVLVKDINPGEQDTYTFMPTNVNDAVYFFTQRIIAGNQIELWKTNGTDAGTVLVTSVGDCGCILPSGQVAWNGKLFFLINNSLWESDGTAGGTKENTDELFSDPGISNTLADLTVSGNRLYFSAATAQYGTELYSGSVTSATYSSAANGNWNSPATWVGNAVPTAGSAVVIRHNVTANVSTSCSSLRVEKPGSFTVNAGISFILLR